MLAAVFLEKVSKILDRHIFNVSGTEISLFSVCLFGAICLLSFLLSKMIQSALAKAFGKRFVSKEGSLIALLRLFHYFVILIGFTVALEVIGIKVSSLFAAGAVFALAIGFAMQNIIQNFVSGVILLLERSIKPGDVLEVDGHVVKVIEMGIRTTVVRTWREEDVIVPNAVFSQSPVKNFTFRDRQFRIDVAVGVSYSSDMKKVIAVLEATAKEISWRLLDVEPRVLLQDFGASSVNFTVGIGIEDPWNQRQYRSDLRKALWFALKEENITIAFPQLDVHFDPEAVSNLAVDPSLKNKVKEGLRR